MKPLFTDVEQELTKSAELEKYLIEKGSLCTSNSDDECNRRIALETLETLAKKWVLRRRSQDTDTGTSNLDGDGDGPSVVLPTIITFGSYSLRVHRKDSDIDVLCLFDKSTTREIFFSSFVDFLRQDSRVSNLLAIENAFTPVVKFLLNGIHIDLIFSRVSDDTKLIGWAKKSHGNPSSSESQNAFEHIRNEYKIDDSDLEGMDEAGVRSMNGARVTQFIDQSVKNVPGFRTCLCAIKEWAISHGIYSNMLGFLGGINFAILLAHVCLQYPESGSWPPSVLFKQFFRTFALWEWPQPVMLTRETNRYPPHKGTRMQVWDPNQNSRDVMPIITPVYPSMNSSHNVSLPQYRRIQDELIRTAVKVEQDYNDWNELLQGCDFFRRNSNFIQVTISTKNKDEYFNWSSFCRSKLRFLIASLETRQTSIWPFAKCFEDMSHPFEGDGSSHSRRSYFFLALRFTPKCKKVNLKNIVLDFLHKVNAFKARTEGMDLQISHTLQQQLPAFILRNYVNGSPNSSSCSREV